MESRLWHKIMKRVAPVVASAVMMLFPSIAKGQNQSQEKQAQQTTQEQLISASEKSIKLNQIADGICPPDQRQFFPIFFLDRKFDEMVEHTIQSFLEAQEKAKKDGLTSFQYDKQTFDATNDELAKDKFIAYYKARTAFKKKYTFQNKSFSTESMLSPLEQMTAYNNINDEIMQTKDIETAILIHKIAVLAVASKRPSGPKSEYYLLIAEKAKRYCELLGISGNPGVYPTGYKRFDLLSVFAKNAEGHFTPNMLSKGGNIFLNRFSQSTFIGEIAHAFREKNNAVGEAGHFLKDAIKDLVTGKNLGFTPAAQLDNYTDVSKMEFDAHEVVKPILEAYADGRIADISLIPALIQEERERQGYSHMPTHHNTEQILKGKIKLIDKMIAEEGASEELSKLRKAAEKQLKNRINVQKQRARMHRHHSGGGHH